MYAVMWSRALLLQVVAASTSSGCRPRRRGSSSVRARTPASSTSGDGIAAAIRIESHNHPSAIEPYQGAATGVGGILRDIFTMGARPIAVHGPAALRPARRRPQPLDRRGRRVSGISGYGNSVGVPDGRRRGGLRRHATPSNPLVNVLCLGVLPTERLVLGQASGRRQPRRAARLDDGSRRHRRRERAGLGRLRRRRSRGDQAPERAGRRPVRGEAADRSVPHAARRGARRRHPGPRRRRPHLRDQRDRVARRCRHGRRRVARCRAANRAWSRSR